ncbi:UrcA family protein [Qipengyuania qiaonensis]|uniref:UrcA family protein n=1 Tax=Qipengyuania qiaonensis TaxID=2867240 RepID=A0ABS7JB23_9SPHN|nr:UrcA family protein [Qipengyuania qiaonensis]MBX7482217.1 UrcA family protein [Qipengyuania qiaonensis]
MKTTLATIAAIGIALTAGTAHAKSITVTYDDLNLGTAAGQKVLSQRIDKAARDACGYSESRTGTRLQSREAKACFEKAKADVSEQFAALVEDQSLGG